MFTWELYSGGRVLQDVVIMEIIFLHIVSKELTILHLFKSLNICVKMLTCFNKYLMRATSFSIFALMVINFPISLSL
jgi:hypothetical protein